MITLTLTAEQFNDLRECVTVALKNMPRPNYQTDAEREIYARLHVLLDLLDPTDTTQEVPS